MTISTLEAVETSISQSFAQLDQRIASSGDAEPLRVLRRRLLGELVMDTDLIAGTLGPDFTLVMHAGGPAFTTSGSDMMAGLAASAAQGGTAMWVEFVELLGDDVLAGHGTLHTLLTPEAAAGRGLTVGAADLSLSSTPIALFVSYDGGLMANEVLYADFAATEAVVLTGAAMPGREQLLSLVGTTG